MAEIKTKIFHDVTNTSEYKADNDEVKTKH